ncbi:MAG: TolC family protein [Candidatus Saganbacteria bacterium]|nr:TolC family protein [Candidatus Saganbacteria bacterium]
MRFAAPAYALESYALNLKGSIALALKQNPAVQAGRKKAEAAGAKLNQAIGAFFPTISLDGSLSRSYTQPSSVVFNGQVITFGLNDPQTTKNFQASLSQPLFVAALLPGYGLARKGAELADQDLRKISLETAFSVTQAYFSVIKAGRSVKLAQESKEMANSHLKQVRTMVSAGVATRADFLRAEVQVANSDVALTKARNALELAKDAFNNVLGNDLEQPVELEEEGFAGEVANLPEYKTLLSQAFASRPDWQQYLLATGLSQDNLRLAQTEYFPTVMLNAASGNQSVENPLYSSSASSWSVAGAASWKLFDGLGRENRIKEASANLEAQKATEEQVRNGVALEVRDAYLTLKSALDMIGSMRKAVDSAEESYKVSNLRFASGAGTNLEVIDAQVSLNQARYNLLQALFDVEVAKAKINKVVGKEVL